MAEGGRRWGAEGRRGRCESEAEVKSWSKRTVSAGQGENVLRFGLDCPEVPAWAAPVLTAGDSGWLLSVVPSHNVGEGKQHLDASAPCPGWLPVNAHTL